MLSVALGSPRPALRDVGMLPCTEPAGPLSADTAVAADTKPQKYVGAFLFLKAYLFQEETSEAMVNKIN